MEKSYFLQLLNKLPKTELHLHIEGSLEPELIWSMAKKNNIQLPYESVESIREAYQFTKLQDFLDIYYQGARVLVDEEDFFSLMWHYLCKCKDQNIVHTEVMFDPQTHTHRGIDFHVVMSGFSQAIKKAQDEFGLSVMLIMSFLRHLSEEDAFNTLKQAEPYYEMIEAVGLDSSELNNPPAKFKNVFEKAKSLGFKRVAHAGEEGPASYVWESIQALNVDRIDHGVRSLEDSKLVAFLRHHQLPLTVCPLSNLRLGVVDSMKWHNLLALLEEGVMVTVNSDDPSYFGGYLNDNYLAIYESLDMTEDQFLRLVTNGFQASFLPVEQKQKWISEIYELVKIVA